MTPILSIPQEMFFVVLTLVFFAVLVSDFRNSKFFRDYKQTRNPWKDLSKDVKVLMCLLVAFMTFAQDKDSQQIIRDTGLTGMTLGVNTGRTLFDLQEEALFFELYGDSLLQGGLLEENTGISWAVQSGNPPFTSNAILTTNQFQAGFACVAVTNIQPSDLDAPTNAVVFTNWPYAVARQAVFLPQGCLPEGFNFGGRPVTNLYMAASGVLSFDAPKSSPRPATNGIPDGTPQNYIAVFQTPSDIVPTNGLFWYAPGTNSSLFTWKDVYLGQDTNCLATVQAELYQDGDFTCRYYFPSLTNSYASLTNTFLIGAQNSSGGETVLHTNALSTIHPSFLPAFELQWKAFGDLLTKARAENDFDDDGLFDADELFIYRSDPRNPDSDGDALMDGEEISLYGTDPNAFSSDASGQGDLWQMLGGLAPSDAPYTNAVPSGFIGILTVTTFLENAPTGGGAVLRIGNQYIPVLAGTTLVSRIAVPRDATNIFILARGVNCDNAVAHVTVEASTFTKICDPSGVFSWSFVLSPSCVTASGTLVMPSYTITPAVVCFHSPTSSVCRITSADPDIYFWTTQGLVREYTPQVPEIPPESFSNGTIQVSLVSMDMTLSTRASVTNIPAHFCNPNGDGSDDYPNGEAYEEWCEFVDGEHIWAPGFSATNCPCLSVTNAFSCPCSGNGQRPCTCAHAVYDAKAMPPEAVHTNLLGHAALVIGGTNDHLYVTVPEDTWWPCPLCACASGIPSSASVYRQTSCIGVTPGILTTNGIFSVAGVHPSTNFEDTVFIYREADYSGSTPIISYTRKDYTVLGTAVYPTDPGHSVSNWFIGCGISNALTLWTGVKLPSDTGDVTLSVTIESGTPVPQLYVYNRAAQSNDLLVTQGQFTYTQNLGDWRDTYCDTNGYAQAYLLCARGGEGRVTHSYATYSGQPYDLSCVAAQRFTVWNVDLDVDTDRDGDIAEADDEGEDVWTILRGALAHPYLVDLYTTQDAPHTNLSRIAIACSNTLQGITFRLKAVDSETKDLMTFVDEGGMGIGFDSNSMIDIPCCPTNLYVAAPEPRKTSGNMPVRFTVDLEALYMGQVIAKDRVLLAVTPVILPPECNEAETVYASSTNLLASIPGLELIPSVVDIWTQDQVKFVKTQHAAGANNDLAVTLSHPDTANLEYVLRHTNKMPYCQWPVNGQGGNMMATPPLGADSPYGKLMLGTKNLQSQSRWVAQGIQPVVEISNDWLLVGHVDEILMWSAPDKVLFADPWKAADLLHGEIAAGRETGGLWFGVDAAGTNRTIREVVIATNNSSYKIGQIMSSLPYSADPTNVVFSVSLFEVGDILRVDNEIFALQAISANGLTGTVQRAQANRPPSAHTNGSVVYAYSTVMRKNLFEDVSVVSLISIATNQLKQALGGYQADFIPIPVLFDDGYIDVNNSNRTYFAAQTANMVNCLVLNSQSAYYSDPGNAVFRNSFESVVPGASAIDIWYNYHCGFGEIHCGTAVKRVLSAQPPWWEQTVQEEQWEEMP